MAKERYTKEQVIAQHEKNVQDFQYQTVQSIENLKRQFIDVQKAVSDMQVRQVSIQNDLKAETQLISTKISDHIRGVTQMVGDLKSELLFHKEQVDSDLANVKLLYISVNDAGHAWDKYRAKLNDLELILQKFQKAMESNFRVGLADFNNQIQSFTQHILNAPIPELDQIPILKDQIASAKIDKDGVLQELRALKKQVFIQSKYIEKLQTDLEIQCRKSQ